MSNITINFNAPININADPMIDPEDIQDLLEMVSDLECLICEMDAPLKHGPSDDEEQDTPDPDRHMDAAMDNGIPVVVCVEEEIPEELRPILAAVLEMTDPMRHFMSKASAPDGSTADDVEDTGTAGKDVGND